MLFFIFLVFGVSKGVIGNDDICDEPAFRACDTSNDFGFPKSEEEIHQICPIILQALNCLKGYSDKCGHHGQLTKERFQKLRSLVEDVCLENSLLHLGVVQNIACFNEVVENDYEACSVDIRPKSRAVYEYIRNIEAEKGFDEDTHDEDLFITFQCLTYSLKMACFASKASERCGPDAKDVAIEVLDRANKAHPFCSESSEEKLAELLAILDLESEEEVSLNRIILKK